LIKTRPIFGSTLVTVPSLKEPTQTALTFSPSFADEVMGTGVQRDLSSPPSMKKPFRWKTNINRNQKKEINKFEKR
jgi:hypothetical protein